jgi:hypothetical protein
MRNGTYKIRFSRTNVTQITIGEKWVKFKKARRFYSTDGVDRCIREPAFRAWWNKECRIHLSCTTLRGDPTGIRTQSVFSYNVPMFRGCLDFRAEGSIIHLFNLEWGYRKFLPKVGKFLQVCKMSHHRCRLLSFCPPVFFFSDLYPSKGAFLHTECIHMFVLSLRLNNLNIEHRVRVNRLLNFIR